MTKAHTADSFDGGRAASIIAEPELPPKMTKLSLRALIEVRANSDDDDARALAILLQAPVHCIAFRQEMAM